MKRDYTHQIMVGSVPMGGGTPVVVQSMLNAPAEDAKANLEQIKRFEQAGCEVIRMTVLNRACVPAFAEVCEKSSLPVVGDIHYKADLAIAAIENGAAKIRVNPGNLGGLPKTDAVIDTAKKYGVPIRIGVNAGSLDDKLKQREDLTLAEKLVCSAKEYVEYFYAQDFYDIVVSTKAHDVMTCVQAYRLLAEEMPEVPLHLGITEAGTAMQGAIKSAAGLGILLEEGIGDTIRISLTDDPVKEVTACWQLLSALDLRRRGPEIISCPTCGRTKVDLISLAKKVEEKIADNPKPLKVAVMGCIVNGPGEAADADIGVACGSGSGAVFVHGKVIRRVPESDIVDALIEEMDKL